MIFEVTGKQELLVAVELLVDYRVSNVLVLKTRDGATRYQLPAAVEHVQKWKKRRGGL